jgi:hypothetical protein
MSAEDMKMKELLDEVVVAISDKKLKMKVNAERERLAFELAHFEAWLEEEAQKFQYQREIEMGY